MKGRQSGMPEEAYWNSFFDAVCVIKNLLGEEGRQRHAVELLPGIRFFASGLTTSPPRPPVRDGEGMVGCRMIDYWMHLICSTRSSGGSKLSSSTG